MLLCVPVLGIDRPQNDAHARIPCRCKKVGGIEPSGRAKEPRRDAAALRNSLRAGDEILVCLVAAHILHVVVAAAMQPDLVALLRSAAERLRKLRHAIGTDKKCRPHAACAKPVQKRLGQLARRPVVKGQRDTALFRAAAARPRHAEGQKNRRCQRSGKQPLHSHTPFLIFFQNSMCKSVQNTQG